MTAWPVGDVLDTLADGAVVPTKTLGATTTDSSGNFTFRQTTAGLSSDYVSPNGAANVEFDASSNNSDMTFSAVLTTVGSQAASDEVETAANENSPMRITYDLQAASITSQVKDQPARSISSANGADASQDPSISTTPDHPGPPYSGCGGSWYASTSYPGRSEHFMNLYSYGTATVDESIGSSHEVGVGVAVTGGGWKASGSISKETKSSAGGNNDFSGSLALSNKLNYRKYYQICYKNVANPSPTVYHKYEVKATSFNALLSSSASIPTHVFTVTDASCTYYAKGNWRKTSGANITFSGGVDAPYLSLSAKASYSGDTSVTWHIPSVGALMCGSSSAGWASARYAGSQKYTHCASSPTVNLTTDSDVEPSANNPAC